MRKILVLTLFISQIAKGQEEIRLFGLGSASDNHSLYSFNLDGEEAKANINFNQSLFVEYNNLIEYNGKIIGSTLTGGENNNGQIYSINTDGSDFEVLYNFKDGDGRSPTGDWVIRENILWGTCGGGGSHSVGTIFTLNLTNNVFTKIHDFDELNGAFPVRGLFFVNGYLWGTTVLGGVNNEGVLFQIDVENQNFVKVFDFDYEVSGIAPLTNLIQNDHELWGIVQSGVESPGAIFAFNMTDFSFRLIKKFGFDETTPRGGLTKVNNDIFGIGNGAKSAVFKIDRVTEEITVYDFTENPGNISSYLTVSNNKLWNISLDGGADGKGSIFYFNNDDIEFSIQYQFLKTQGLREPKTTLLELGGYLYGVADKGGDFGNGAIFKIKNDGTDFQVIFNFDDPEPVGFWPTGNTIQVDDNLFGVTRDGGTNSYGTIFKYDLISSEYSKVFDFDFTNGQTPNGLSLVYYDEKVWGVAERGGINDDGVLFSFDRNGSNFRKVYDFVNLDITENIVLHKGHVYGTSSQGGEFDSGLIFSYDLVNNEFIELFSFDSPNSLDCYLIISNEKLYGISSFGGDFGGGFIFSIDFDGSDFESIYSFEQDSKYGNPNQFLISTEEFFIGAKSSTVSYTSEGTSINPGYIFKIKKDGTDFTNIYDPLEGQIITSNVIHYDDLVYGIASDESNEFGYAFTITNDGKNYKKLVEFNDSFGGPIRNGSLSVVIMGDNEEVFLSADQPANLVIYPNPVSDKLNLLLDQEVKEVIIIDSTGKIILSDTNKTIDLSSFAPGIYNLKITLIDRSVSNHKIKKI